MFLERISACSLNRIFGYEPRFASALIRSLGSASAVFDLSGEELFSILGPFCRYRDRINDGAREESEKELGRLASYGFSFISMSEDCFPSLLRECEDSPAGLYMRSSSPPEAVFNTGPAISVVGTRDISLYGKEWCPKIIGALAESGPTIVSGLAFGVDICAHMAALAYGIPTIAVIPVGIDNVYPSSHRVAAEKIAAAPGSALITDYPPGTRAVPVNFIRRNRIIAGMSQATILVESKDRGGGTMTARLASGYGRDVLALPGRIDDVRSGGCNRLLAEKIAEPLSSLQELPGSLGLGKGAPRRKRDLGDEIRRGRPAGSDPEETALLVKMAEMIKGDRGINLDELCRKGGLGYGRTVALAGILESEGFIDIDLLQRCTIHDKKE